MNDEQLSALLENHSGPAPLGPAFESQLYSILAHEMRAGRSRRRTVLLLAAALVAVATISTAIVVGSGWIEARPHPSPLPSEDPAPPPLLLRDGDLYRQLGHRAYRVSVPFPTPFTLTVPPFPAEWSLTALEADRVQFGQGLGLRSGPFLNVRLGENVWADPCNPEGGPIGRAAPPTVDGLLNVLTHTPGLTAGPVSEVRLGDYEGKAFTLTPSPGSDCAQVRQMWLIDVKGTVIALDAYTDPATTDAVKGEIHAVVESIRFE